MSNIRRNASNAVNARIDTINKQGKNVSRDKEMKKQTHTESIQKQDEKDNPCVECEEIKKRLIGYKKDNKALNEDIRILQRCFGNFDSQGEISKPIDNEVLQTTQGKEFYGLLNETKRKLQKEVTDLQMFLQDKGDKESNAKTKYLPKTKSTAMSESVHVLDDLRQMIQELCIKCKSLEHDLVKDGYKIGVYPIKSINITEDICSQCSANKEGKQKLELHQRELETENLKVKDEKRNLEVQLAKLKPELESCKQDLEKEVDQHKMEQQKLKDQIKKLKSERDNLNTRLEETKLKDKIQVGKSSTHSELLTITEMQSKVDMLTDRLGREMNRKIGKDESSLENISIRNRPMNIASDYSLLCSNAWLDAKQELDKQKKNEEKSIHVLRSVLVEASQQASDIAREVWSCFGAIITDPVNSAVAARKGSKDHWHKNKGIQSDEGKFSPDMQNKFGDFLRQRAETEDITFIAQEISKHKDIQKDHKTIKTYVKECARLGWKMAVQRPQMRFKIPKKGDQWNPKEIELYWGSNPDATSPKVKYLVQPILMHGAAVMVKGKALIN